MLNFIHLIVLVNTIDPYSFHSIWCSQKRFLHRETIRGKRFSRLADLPPPPLS